MYPRKRMDIGTGEVLRTLWSCASVSRSKESRSELQDAVERAWRADGAGLACLSVRSGFDLLLSCVDWPAGSEVIMSAVTMPDMVRVVIEHGYVPVPVDLDIEHMKPVAAEVESAISARTRAIVAAHLFGARPALDALAALTRRHDLLLIEDCAQAYDGPQFTGHDRGDVAMFSFGTIKTATCMGGALLTVRDERLREAMRAGRAAQPLQPRRAYATKALKMLIFLALQNPVVFGAFVWLVSCAGLDHDLVIRRITKGFGRPDFFGAIRRQPCTPLLGCLHRRLTTYPVSRITARSEAARRFFDQICEEIAGFGELARAHNHWVVPIMVGNRAEVIEALRAAGFDATSASSTLAVIDPPDGRAAPPRALAAMAQLVYVPVYPQMTVERRDAMARIINATAKPARPAEHLGEHHRDEDAVAEPSSPGELTRV